MTLDARQHVSDKLINSSCQNISKMKIIKRVLLTRNS